MGFWAVEHNTTSCLECLQVEEKALYYTSRLTETVSNRNSWLFTNELIWKHLISNSKAKHLGFKCVKNPFDCFIISSAWLSLLMKPNKHACKSFRRVLQASYFLWRWQQKLVIMWSAITQVPNEPYERIYQVCRLQKEKKLWINCFGLRSSKAFLKKIRAHMMDLRVENDKWQSVWWELILLDASKLVKQ